MKENEEVSPVNAEDLKKINELKKELMETKTVQELKDILKKNEQSGTGEKEILAEKVADGIVLG